MADLSSLPFRQQRLFRDRVDLFRPTENFADGLPSATTYSLAQADVPCIIDTKSAVDNPELLGLIEGEDMITVDTVRFPEGTVLESSWCILCRSLDRSGAPTLNHGKVWVAKGEPVREQSPDGIRRSGMVEAYATRMPTNAVPAGVA